MNKDAQYIAEAYTQLLEKKATNKKPDADGDGVPDWADKKHGKDKDKEVPKKKTKTRVQEEEEMAAAYDQITEQAKRACTDKIINKKFARRYKAVAAAMLKCEPGSKDYKKYKEEKNDLVEILRDHDMKACDLDDLLTKKEKEAAVEAEPSTVPEVNMTEVEMTEESHDDCSYACKGCKCDGCEDCSTNGRNEKRAMNMSDAYYDTGDI